MPLDLQGLDNQQLESFHLPQPVLVQYKHSQSLNLLILFVLILNLFRGMVYIQL